MWTELPVNTEWVDCNPPLSFYFDIVEKYWKGSLDQNFPFHRVCTLARKMGAKTVFVESASHISHVCEDITFISETLGEDGSAEAISFSFFLESVDENTIGKIDNNSLLGRVILISYKKKDHTEFENSWVFEAILRLPHLPNETKSHSSKRSLLNGSGGGLSKRLT